jgi:hypothetical protein
VWCYRMMCLFGVSLGEGMLLCRIAVVASGNPPHHFQGSDVFSGQSQSQRGLHLLTVSD